MDDQIKNVFIVGIKGTAMANIAVLLKKMGKHVTGTDISEEFITDETLQAHEITYGEGFDPSVIPSETELVLYSAAHGGAENPLVQYAKKEGIKIVDQASVISYIMDKHQVKIAVCGSHGKTTTTALLAFCLGELGARPSYLVGTSSFSGLPAAEYGDGKYMVVEADEYAVDPPTDKTPKFLKLHPTHIVATNIDFDHPDTFEGLDGVITAFKSFMNGDSKLFVCADDENLMQIAKASGYRSRTFGYSETASIQIAEIANDGQLTAFTLKKDGELLGTFKIQLSGEENVSNAAGAIALLLDLGFSESDIQKSLSKFEGAKRRFEIVAHENGIYLYDDYAHHPREIIATLHAARMKFPQSRIVLVFQPHTFSRTSALKSEFIEALSQADKVFIAPIFASARESADGAIRSQDLQTIAEDRKKDMIEAFTTIEELQSKLIEYLRPNDVIFTMGAGDIYKLKNDIIKAVKSV
jgi:UDP-N-acetylmuramate--alanine ligase